MTRDGWCVGRAQRLLSASRRRPALAALAILATVLLVLVAVARITRWGQTTTPAKSPCYRVNLVDDDPDAQRQCLNYLELPLLKPVCSPGQPPVVPAIYHAIDAAAEPPPSVRANLLRNPGYRLNYHNDSSAYGYVLDRCGKEVAEAFRCFLAPAYRADVFRFCAVLKDGGVCVVPFLCFSPVVFVQISLSLFPQFEAWPHGGK